MYLILFKRKGAFVVTQCVAGSFLIKDVSLLLYPLKERVFPTTARTAENVLALDSFLEFNRDKARIAAPANHESTHLDRNIASKNLS